MHGDSKNMVTFSKNGGIVVGSDVLEILEHEDVVDRKVVVYSIVGLYRNGKSFFLNYCLRYLYANVSFFNSLKLTFYN
jgi:hypothetical protein